MLISLIQYSIICKQYPVATEVIPAPKGKGADRPKAGQKLLLKALPVAVNFLNSHDTASCTRVSKEFKASVTFWGLKQNWWKQLVDGIYHEHGPMVFDRGLHEGHVEPGFYQHVRIASNYASEHFFREELSMDLHQKVHQEACAHFARSKPETSGVQLTEEREGFRYRSLKSVAHIWTRLGKEAIEYHRIHSFFEFCGGKDFVEKQKQYEHEQQAQGSKKKTEFAAMWHSIRSRRLLDIFGVDTFQEELYTQKLEEFLPKKEAAYAFRETWPKLWKERIPKTKLYVKNVSQSLGLDEPLVEMSYSDDQISFHYPDSPFEGTNAKKLSVKDVANRITLQFNQEIAQAKSLDERIHCIAKLFQLREWLHAYPDGNTRTNLIELAALLSKYGSNPPILDQPFMASLLCLDEWVAYLKEGIKKWQMEKARL